MTGQGDWLGPNSQIGDRVRHQSEAALKAYAVNRLLVREHVSIERETTQGGYGRRQLYELIQNGADALQGTSGGRIAVVLTDGALYCANQGQPIDADGVDAILSSHLNVKKANEIGRFGVGFKSVLAVTRYPEFYSRSGSFRFDQADAVRRISAAIGDALDTKEVPVLRTAAPVAVAEAAEPDRILRALMEWATTIVKLPRLYGRAEWLSQDLLQFPPEFLLFSPHVGRLSLENHVSGKSREITLQVTPRGLRLRADDRDEMWWTATTNYAPSDSVKEDGGVHAERTSLPLVWAVQLQGRIGRGRFWAFFPTETITTLSGILNAPWKTNQDRQNLLRGPFNEEFIDKAAHLVAASLPSLVVPSDPARHLDLLPSRDSYNWADELLGQTVFDLCVDRAIVPDQDGEPSLGRKLHMHPEGISTKALGLWSEYPGRPRDWVHPDVETFNRRPRVERLVPISNVASHVEWLEALVVDGTALASAAAVKVAALVSAESKPSVAREIRRAKIILSDEGAFESPESVLVSVPGRERTARGKYVALALVADAACLAALRSLGVRESDPATDLAAFLAAGVQGDAWDTFWRLAARIPARQIGDVVRPTGWDPRNLLVRTIAGTWEPIRLTLLPGRVVPPDGSRDGNVAVDVLPHIDVIEHMKVIGLADGPAIGAGWPDEPWLDDFKESARAAFLRSLDRRSGARPREDLISVEELRQNIRLVGPLEVLDVLSPEGRAALTRIALEEGAGPEKVTVSHETSPDRYKRAQIRGPVLWRLRRAGRLHSSAGIVPVTKAVGPQLFPLRAFLPVATCTEAEAMLLKLPATAAEVPRELWADAELGAASCTDVRALGDLVLGLLDADIEPHSVRAQVGSTFEDVLAAEVTALALPERAKDLAGHAIPFVLVGTEVEADRLADRLGMKRVSDAVRFEVAAVLIRDPAPLVDEFPPLRWYIDEKWTSLELARCSELSERVVTASGTTEHPRSYLRSDATVYWDQSGGDEELLLALRGDLDIPITEGDCGNIANRHADQDRARKLEGLRLIDDPFERLATAIGPDAIRARLPAPVVDALEQRRGQLTPGDLGRVSFSLLGTNVLREFRDDLAGTGLEPPMQWSGSASARAFVRDLGFPVEYAGSEHQRLDALLDVDGPPDLPPLHAYQDQITTAIRSLLTQRKGGRALLSLPTGAGKTRIAVQALVNALRERTVASPVLWMAETEELCEQAVQAWAYVWRALGSRDRLHVSRLWSANEAEPIEGGNHVIVATVAKLQNCVGDPLYDWLTSPGCVVVDEAHGAIAPVYTKVLSWLGLSHDQSPRPLIGLTATPYRGTSEEETTRLVNRFYRHRLDDGILGEDQYATLQEMGVLSAVEHELLDGAEIHLTQQELEHLQQTRLMPSSAGARLALNRTRNDALLSSIRSRGSDETVLLFAASVEHAEVLAAELSISGIPSAAISSRTPTGARRHFIEEFRRGRIRVLTNYAVLTEGFDAPAVRAVYVARPTYSPNLYQQMIGRGLRGPLNGGKAKCLIVNVRDNIAQYGEALAFTKFEYLWKKDGATPG